MLHNMLREGTRMDTREIRKMSRAERLATMEALWDSLVEEEAEIESPDWHRSQSLATSSAEVR